MQFPTEPGLLGDTVGEAQHGKVLRAMILRVKDPYLLQLSQHMDSQEKLPLILISNPDNGRGEGMRRVSN